MQAKKHGDKSAYIQDFLDFSSASYSALPCCGRPWPGGRGMAERNKVVVCDNGTGVSTTGQQGHQMLPPNANGRRGHTILRPSVGP